MSRGWGLSGQGLRWEAQSVDGGGASGLHLRRRSLWAWGQDPVVSGTLDRDSLHARGQAWAGAGLVGVGTPC